MLNGEPGFTYGIQVSTNLRDWESLTNLLNTKGVCELLDAPATNSPRFYKAALAF